VIIFMRLRLCVELNISFKREKYNEDNFLNKPTMTAARAFVCSTAYCVNGEKRVQLFVSVYDTAAAETKTDTAAETKQQYSRRIYNS